MFLQILRYWKIEPYLKINQSDYKITFPNGSEIIFIGLDTETKLLSLNNISCIFVEEAFEVEQSFVDQLNLRMRGDCQNQQMILAWNPISKNHWLYDYCSNLPTGSIFTQTTYKDNPFLPSSYVEAIEALKQTNPAKYRIYGLGEWGVEPEGLVITNWECDSTILPSIVADPKLEHAAGLDWGYIDQTAIIDSLYDKDNKIIYVINETFLERCQLDDIVAAIKKMSLTKTRIYCDSAEPRSIEFLKHQGLLALPCIKGPGSVQARIAFLQNNKIIIAGNCPKLKEELENFSYIKKNDKYTDDTTHEWSHGIDALGYSFSNIYTKSKLRTMDKSILGL